jgi:glycerol uptake facilitator-like aquaporin
MHARAWCHLFIKSPSVSRSNTGKKIWKNLIRDFILVFIVCFFFQLYTKGILRFCLQGLLGEKQRASLFQFLMILEILFLPVFDRETEGDFINKWLDAGCWLWRLIMNGYTARTGTSRNLMVVHSVWHRSVSDLTNGKRRSVKMMENLSRCMPKLGATCL